MSDTSFNDKQYNGQTLIQNACELSPHNVLLLLLLLLLLYSTSTEGQLKSSFNSLTKKNTQDQIKVENYRNDKRTFRAWAQINNEKYRIDWNQKNKLNKKDFNCFLIVDSGRERFMTGREFH